MNVTAVQLAPDSDTWLWLSVVMAEPTNRNAMPLRQRTQEWRKRLFNRLQMKQILMLGPAVDGRAAGLYWGCPWENGICSVHQFLMPEFRKGWTAIKVAKVCAAKAFEALPNVRYLMGFTPVDNRAAVLTAKRAGFKFRGSLPEFQDHTDCAVLVKERA